MIRDDIQYVLEHPPRCIAALRPKPVVLAVPTLRLPRNYSIYQGTYDHEDIASFVVGCTCGCPSVYLLGYYITDKKKFSGFVGPLSIECSACSLVSEVFDTRKHGYDGEQGVNTHYVGEGVPTRFNCPICGVVPMIVSTNFAYSDFAKLPSDMRARAQDFFDGFDIVCQCTRCNSVIEVTSFECA
jgi:hypothetical protein